MLENWKLPLLMTVLAGFATVIGGFITFLVNKNNLKILSLGLGFSAGVMIFVSFTEILSTAEGLLKTYYPVSYHWIMFWGFIAGVIISKLIDTFIPDHVEEDLLNEKSENCKKTHRIKRAGLLTAIAIAVHNFPEGLGTFLVSSNVCTARLMDAIGVRPVIQLARVMGITTPIPYDYTISLGSNSVKLFEMTRAYGVFANGGFKVEPFAIERIESSRGTILYEAKKARSSKVLNLNTAATMTAIMKTVITNGTGRAANIGKPAAGKTGTTDDSKDAYFIGFTPDVVTGVWVGNDDNSQMGGITGGTVPALIWKDVMTVATAPYGNADFEYPEVILNPFRAPGVSIIPQSEAKKKLENKEKEQQEAEKEKAEEQKTPAPVVKPAEILQQTLTPIKKKETPMVEVKSERTEAPQPQFAPIPVTSAPIGQQQ